MTGLAARQEAYSQAKRRELYWASVLPPLVRVDTNSSGSCLALRDVSTATPPAMLAGILLTQPFELTSESATVNWPRKNLVLPLKLPGTLVEGARGPST